MIHDDTQCILGEGPLWHPLREELLWFDILSNSLHMKGRSWSFERNASAAGWLDAERLLVADSIGLHILNLGNGALEEVVRIEADNPITRSNDGRADPWGGFWIGTMGHNAEKSAGAIYRYYRGEVRPLFSGLTITNAICFAPDGGHAYFCDTVDRKIMRQRLGEKEGWPVDDPEVYLDFGKVDWGPDGAVVDAAGNFWNAQWGAGRVACYAPHGALIETVAVPGVQATCPAFGGSDLRTLYCTTAADGLDGPDEGKTFTARVEATGQKEHQVIL